MEQIIDFLIRHKHFLILILVLVIGRILIITVYKRRKGLKKKDNFVVGINNVTFVLGAIWLFFFTLFLFGISIREFFTSIAIIAAALAVTFKEYIMNGLNGMLLMFGENVMIGDFVKVGSEKGKIENMTLLQVHLLNDEDDMVIIPNNQFMASNIINYSRNPRHYTLIDFELRALHPLKLEPLEKELAEALQGELEYIRENTMKLKVVEIKNDIIHYRFRFGLKDYDPKLENHLKQLVWARILQFLKK